MPVQLYNEKIKLLKVSAGIPILIVCVSVLAGCGAKEFENASSLSREPVIEPDYSGITVPYNIAPLNFVIKERAKLFYIKVISPNGHMLTIKSSGGVVHFPIRPWKKLLENNRGRKLEIDIVLKDNSDELKKYNPVHLYVANESIDPFLCYRLLYPGYESWVEMKIVSRSIENFRETSLVENQLLDYNCVNCHSFKQNSPDKFLLHVRGSKGGTYFNDGKKLTRRTLRTPEMNANAVYPSWHPSGRYVAFSSNKTVQSFHMRPEKNIEVSDQFSSLIIYDTETNEIFPCPESDTVKYMETYPCWSPDGEFLYYCRTRQVKKGYEYTQVKYDLVRKSFNQASGTFGNAEVIFDALAVGKSVSFPAISLMADTWSLRFMIMVLFQSGIRRQTFIL